MLVMSDIFCFTITWNGEQENSYTYRFLKSCSCKFISPFAALLNIKGATKLYFTRYLYVVIILITTSL